ncbi:MAG: DNA-binding transcriptional MerR regulator/methylmalonyl-CoA mutase cobalamin-binding subunit [Candidatus Krumholzibacteriia bacterium]
MKSVGKDESVSSDARHSIAVISRRTGLTQLVLRAWERRYGAVSPSRTDTGRRLYTDKDLEKLSYLQLLTNAGHRIGDVATLSIADLKKLAAESQAAEVNPAPQVFQAPSDNARILLDAKTAVEKLDDKGLKNVLEGALLHLSKPVLRRDILVPLMEYIGAGWRSGSLRISNEHMASTVVTAFLVAINSRYQVMPGAPLVVVATPAGQVHEIGALLATSQAYESGWDVLYLGANLPAEEIAAVAAKRGARAVMLSLVFPTADPGVGAQLRVLRELVGPDFPVIVGGKGAASYDMVLKEIQARVVAGTGSLNSVLASI